MLKRTISLTLLLCFCWGLVGCSGDKQVPPPKVTDNYDRGKSESRKTAAEH